MAGSRHRHSAATLILVAAAVALSACGGPPPPPSVVLVSIDTLRPDHLGSYGYAAETSPSIDAWRDDAVLFAEAFAPAPSTLPSHASLFSSLLPQHHAASAARSVPLPEEVLTLAEVMGQAGYRTAAFTGAGQLDPAFGFAQGFEIYRAPIETLADAAREGLAWIDGLDGEPFFLFLHTYEVHHPYEPEPELLERFSPGYAGALPEAIGIDLLRAINRGEVEIDEADLARIVAAYDAEIFAMDRSFGRLVEELRARGLYDSSLVVLTSDHGEEFGEHGRVGWHSHTLYDELLRVPLLIKLPGGERAGARVEKPARLIDVAPTVTAALGVPTPADFRGVDLFGQRPAGAVPVVAKIDHRLSFEALRLGRWKWFAGRLFDLESDPGELDDLAASDPETAARLEERLRELVEEREALAGEAIEPDEETLERLRALGYIE